MRTDGLRGVPGLARAGCRVAHDRFVRLDISRRVMALATIQHSDGAGASLRFATDAVMPRPVARTSATATTVSRHCGRGAIGGRRFVQRGLQKERAPFVPLIRAREMLQNELPYARAEDIELPASRVTSAGVPHPCPLPVFRDRTQRRFFSGHQAQEVRKENTDCRDIREFLRWAEVPTCNASS